LYPIPATHSVNNSSQAINVASINIKSVVGTDAIEQIIIIALNYNSLFDRYFELK